MLRKSFILLFVSAIILQSGFVSVYTLVCIRQHKAVVKARMKAELKNGLHNPDLEIFTEARMAAARWVHAKEFFLGSGKYDIVRVTGEGKDKLYHCINDTREMALYKSLDKHGKQKNVLEDVMRKFCARLASPHAQVLFFDASERFYPPMDVHFKTRGLSSLFRPPARQA